MTVMTVVFNVIVVVFYGGDNKNIGCVLHSWA